MQFYYLLDRKLEMSQHWVCQMIQIITMMTKRFDASTGEKLMKIREHVSY